MGKQKTRSFLIWLAVIGGTGLLLGFNTLKSYFGGDTKSELAGVPCINPLLPIPEALHIHPNLKITVLGENVPVPANVGLGLAKCERALHTHDGTGKIHIEPNAPQDFTLGQFFKLWDKPFSRDRILDREADAEHEVVFTVNGEPNGEYENLILRDKQQIVIEYRGK